MKTVVGLYDDIDTANQVVQALVDSGIERDAISLVAGDREGKYTSARSGDNWNRSQTTDTGDAAAGGALTGAVVGGVGGALLSLSALAIPGIGPVIAAGPLVAGLIGAGAGAAVGGLVGALTEAGLPEDEAGYYVEGVNHGGTLVSVRADDDEKDGVVAIMNRYNPINVKERAASWRSEGRPDYSDSASRTATEQAVASNYARDDNRSTERTAPSRTSSNRPADTSTTYDRASYAAQTKGGNEESRIPVVEENVQVGKRTVEQGGVRVRKRIEEEPVEKQVNLREENVSVERHPVNRPANASDFNTFEEGEFEVTAVSEEPVVQKEAQVVEEVVINKDARERTETVRDTARKTRVEVEQSGANGNTVRQESKGYDTAGFRSHYQTNYGNSGHTFADYDPAYRYGYTVANDARYRGRNWNEIEADLRRDWNQNHKGSAWEDFKDAVRYSWERTKAAVTS